MTPYQIYAKAESGRAVKDSGLYAGKFHASYTEADAPSIAIERCLKQFPIADGWAEHYAVNLDTSEIIKQAEEMGLDIGDL